MAARPIRVGLLWHSASSGNLGVRALTVGNIRLVRQVARDLGRDVSFLILGMRDGKPGPITGTEVDVFDIDTLSLLSPGGYWKAIKRQDCILDIGAGDSFAEIYGLKRFLFIWLTKMAAVVQRKPLLLAPQTIGPFTRTPYRQLARLALQSARVSVARDHLSFDAVRALAPGAKCILSTDTAFALPYEDNGHLRGGSRIRVGINVSGLLYNEARRGSNRFALEADYAELMGRFIAEASARRDVEVHLFTHVVDQGEWDDDSAVADKMADAFPTARRVPNFAGPSEAKSYLSGLDVVVAGRMHACIAAFATGAAVVPVGYSRKFTGLFELLDYPWTLDARVVGTDAALARLWEAIDARDVLARDAAAGMARVGTLLEAYRSELRGLFEFVGSSACP